MKSIDIITNNIEETQELAKQLGELVNSPQLILLNGDMSAGKTQFSKAFTKSYGSEDDTSSPTYTIINEYNSPKGKIYHLDLYRISDYDELYSIGLDDLLREKATLLIEWPEVAELTDQADLNINIEILDNSKRNFKITGSDALIDALASLY